VLHEGHALDTELCVPQATGAPRLVRIVARRFAGPEGGAAGIVGSVEDVTAQRDQARRLDAKRHRSELIEAATGVATIEWNVITREVRPSPQWAALTGHAAADIAAGTIEEVLELIHPDDLTRLLHDRAAAVATNSDDLEHEFRMRHKDGHWVWVLSRSRVFSRTQSGLPEWIFASQIDITARKRMEEHLLRNEKLLSKTGAVARVGGWELDLVSGVLVWTDETCRIHGLPPGVLPELSRAIAFYAPASQPIIRAAVETAIATGQGYDLELQMIRADGTTIWVRTVGSAEIEAGRVVRLHGALQDINERVLQQQALLDEHRRVALATDVSGIGIWELDLDNNGLSWDPRMFSLYGRPGAAGVVAADQVWAESLHPEDRAMVYAELDAAVTEGRRFDVEFRVIWPDRSERHIRALAEVVASPGSGRRILLGVNWDVTQLRTLTTELARQHEWMRVTLRSIGDAVITTDARGAVTWLNPVAELMTGWGLSEAIGLPIEQVFHVLSEATLEPAENPVETCLRERRVVALAAGSMLISRNGQPFGIEDSAAPIRDDENRILGVVLVFHDVTTERRLVDEMIFRATHDALTGATSRSEFELRLTELLAQGPEGHGPHALLFIDLDQFKLVNDSCGHAAGDQVLQQVARLFADWLRPGDTLARIGGDEFALLLTDCVPDAAAAIAQGICDRMEHFRFVQGDKRLRLGASVGLVPLDGRWASAVAALQAADAACLAAKEAGRNRVRIWHDIDTALTHRRDEVNWVSRIEQALEHGEFDLFAQEIRALDPDTPGLRGEFLLRLREADGSWTAPGRILHSAERFELIGQIDRWVLRRALTLLTAHQGPACPRRMAVNVSGRSLGDRAFHKFAIEVLGIAGPGICQRLEIEITETSAVANLVDAAHFIEQLHALGVRVSLDDFGAGSSSFGYLRALKVDCLKIDGQFVQGLATDPLSRAMVRCFVDVAEVLGVPTIAEYVDRPELLEVLREMRVDFAQGYLLGKPQPFETFLATHGSG
jgi:diguanylate cyclase (GGDEF)-like protein/PAS domain S-box-containing protein